MNANHRIPSLARLFTTTIPDLEHPTTPQHVNKFWELQCSKGCIIQAPTLKKAVIAFKEHRGERIRKGRLSLQIAFVLQYSLIDRTLLGKFNHPH